MYFFLIQFETMKQTKNTKVLNAIRQVFKHLRVSKSLTQEVVSNDIQNSLGVIISIGRVETGENDLSISTISLLCDYYQISLSDFFQKVEEIKKDLS
jgi:transcriptional regulator with XRE-family HTH domain